MHKESVELITNKGKKVHRVCDVFDSFDEALKFMEEERKRAEEKDLQSDNGDVEYKQS